MLAKNSNSRNSLAVDIIEKATNNTTVVYLYTKLQNYFELEWMQPPIVQLDGVILLLDDDHRRSPFANTWFNHTFLQHHF